MTPRELEARLGQRPFIPFQMVLKCGYVVAVRDPEGVTVGRHLTTVRSPAGVHHVSMIHVVRLEPLPSLYRPAKP
jgi:hypothetical protein